MKYNKKILASLTVCLGLGLFFIGIFLSQRKPLWNDELYTQTVSVERPSYRDIVQGHLGEGNNFPLFYLIQKAVCDLTGYRLGDQWHNEWQLSEPRGQVTLRISSNFFMSLSLAALFYFFSHNFSLGVGIYALLVALSSSMVWGYWAEARPYALWFFLTTLQTLIFLSLLKGQESSRRKITWLSVVHLLMSLTVPVGIMQAAFVSLLLWFHHKGNWRNCLLLLFVLPFVVFSVYAFQSPSFRFFLPAHPQELILANFHVEWAAVFIIYAIFCFSGNKIPAAQDQAYLIFMSGIFLSAVMIIGGIAWMSPQHGEVAFEISSRYFIYLVPAGIVGVVLFSIQWLRAFQGQTWMLVNTVIVLSGILVLRFLKTLAVLGN